MALFAMGVGSTAILASVGVVNATKPAPGEFEGRDLDPGETKHIATLNAKTTLLLGYKHSAPNRVHSENVSNTRKQAQIYYLPKTALFPKCKWIISTFCYRL